MPAPTTMPTMMLTASHRPSVPVTGWSPAGAVSAAGGETGAEGWTCSLGFIPRLRQAARRGAVGRVARNRRQLIDTGYSRRRNVMRIPRGEPAGERQRQTEGNIHEGE